MVAHSQIFFFHKRREPGWGCCAQEPSLACLGWPTDYGRCAHRWPGGMCCMWSKFQTSGTSGCWHFSWKSFPIVTVGWGPTIRFKCEPAVCGDQVIQTKSGCTRGTVGTVGICCVYTRNPPFRVRSARSWLVTPEWSKSYQSSGSPCRQEWFTRFVRKTLHHHTLPPPPSFFMYASPALNVPDRQFWSELCRGNIVLS